MKGSVVAFGLALALAHGPVGGASAAALLRMNSQFTATAEGSKIDQWFADEVERTTGGEVKIQIFWAGALGGPKENLRLLESGAIDLAAMSPAYFPAELPLFAAPNSLPMTLQNLRQASALMPRLLAEVPAFGEEAAAHGIRPLFFHLLNPYLLMSKTPIRTLADLRGKRVRTWGEDLPRLFLAAGATPVNILIPEIYENLQHGVIDAIPFSVDLAVTYKVYEVVRHVTEVVVWLGPAWGVWVNEARWQGLAPEHRARIREAADRARARELETTARAGTEARATLAARGVSFHPFPAAELARWQAAAPDFLADWVARMAAQGKGDAARRTVEILEQVRRELP